MMTIKYNVPGQKRKELAKTISARLGCEAKSLKKAKDKLRELTSRSQGRNVRAVMENVKVFIRGWLGYFGIADMRAKNMIWPRREKENPYRGNAKKYYMILT